MNFKIRTMYDADVEAVYAIERTVHITPWSKQIIHDCVAVGYDCRVLELSNEVQSTQKTIVGYIISRYNHREYHILNLCITKAMQSQGVGKQLLQAILDSLIKDNLADTILLEVRPSNTPALRLYKRLGFEPIEIKKEYYKDSISTEDAIVLKKIIRSLNNPDNI